MRSLDSFEGVYLYREPVDMRLWLDGLAALVRNGMKLPLDGRFLFVFVGKRKDRLKLLYWDRTGYALWYKRLERARFAWPKDGDAVVHVSPELFDFLLGGVDVFVRPHAPAEIAVDW